MKEAIGKLVPFIPQNLRLDIFLSLWEEYRDKEALAQEIGCKSYMVERWLKGRKAPSNKFMPRILSLALRSYRVKEMLQKELLEQIENLLAELNIFPEKKENKNLGQILDLLDEQSRKLLWHLWWNRHAEIGELAEITKAESDMEILSRIKKTINPIAKQNLGKEILRFENSRIDPVTGEKVLFSWWLEEDSLLGRRTEPLVDIFEENDHIAVIAQLPAPMRLAEEAKVESKKGILKVKVKKEGHNGRGQGKGRKDKGA